MHYLCDSILLVPLIPIMFLLISYYNRLSTLPNLKSIDNTRVFPYFLPLFGSLFHPYLTCLTFPSFFLAFSHPNPSLFQRGVNVLKGLLPVTLARWRGRQRSIHEALFVSGPERRETCLRNKASVLIASHVSATKNAKGIMASYGCNGLFYRCPMKLIRESSILRLRKEIDNSYYSNLIDNFYLIYIDNFPCNLSES